MRDFSRPEASTYVQQYSIVKPLQQAGMFNPDRLLGTDFMNVEVVSIPSETLIDNGRRSRPVFRESIVPRYRDKNRIMRDGQPAVRGTKGWILRSELERMKAKDLTYIVKSNAPLLQIPGGALPIAGRALRLSKAGAGYNVSRCCPANLPFLSKQLGLGCRDNYIFEILNEAQSCIERTIELNTEGGCAAFSGYLRPIATDQAQSLAVIGRAAGNVGRGVQNVEMIDTRGLVKFPFDPVTQRGPYNSFHYTPDNNSNDDTFLNSTSACALARVLEAHAKECTTPGCEIMIGDFYHLPEWKVHGSHGNGQCFDIRPLGTRMGLDPRSYRDGDYDRTKTLRLIELFIQAGARRDQIGFNDPAAKRLGAKTWPSHDDHVHICLPDKPDPRVQQGEDRVVNQTCKNGLNSTPPVAAAPPVQPRSMLQVAAGMFGFMPPAQPTCQ